MDQRTAVQWVIRVDGSNVAIVEPGETVEIGRKPIRPLPQGPVRRIEIADTTRSMSKRHAEFSVKLDGTAFIRDLHSTNGTYILREGNQLIPLGVGRDYQLQHRAARLLFGDVVVEFIAQPLPAKSQEFRVPNLFDYATDDSRTEEADSNMSVDDILNLRAGEPTDLFNADSVKTRARQLKNAERRSYSPFVDPLAAPLASETWSAQDAPEDPEAHPRDLFADAQDIAAGRMEEPAPKVDEFVPRVQRGPRHKSTSSPQSQPTARPADVPPATAMPDPVQAAAQAMRFQPVRAMAEPDPAEVEAAEKQAQEQAPVAIEAVVTETVAPDEQENAPVADEVVAAEEAVKAVTANQQVAEQIVEEEVVEPSTEDQPNAGDDGAEVNQQAPQDAPQETPDGTVPQEHQETYDPVDFSEVQFADNDTVAVEQHVEAVDEPTEAETTQAFNPLAMDDESEPESQDYSRFQRPNTEPQTDAQPQYQPAFEPGSVFERVSKGEYDHPQELVEAGGFTSTDARRSDDFAEQFEMARHAELLPFLAMNPSLYDDLYAWLAAQGDSDIDKALNGNPGYEDYKKAVGK